MKKNLIGLPVAENATGPLGADSTGLEPSAVGHGRIGCVDEVNGEGATEVPEFVPTREEICQIAKYWIRKYYDTHLWCWYCAMSGSQEWRVLLYADRRIARIAEILGNDLVDRARREVMAEFEKGDPQGWAMYTSGVEPLRDDSGIPVRDADGKLIAKQPEEDLPAE